MSTKIYQRFYVYCALVLCFGMAQAGQLVSPSPPARSEPLPFVPALRVHGAEKPVRMQTLDVHVGIQCGFAEVTLDMLFANPNNRVLEGELRFPLFPGQEINGLALDVRGEMRRGVPVSKTRGQELFDTVVRRNVDPALLEATQGNNYKLRIYPIPAKGTRRVKVRIQQPLAEMDGMFSFRMPLAFAKNIENFSVTAVVASSEPPQVESGSLGLVLERIGILYQGMVKKTGLSPEGWLVVNVPTPENQGNGVSVARWRDSIYFTAITSVPTQTRQRALPKMVTIVWDASGSGQNRDHVKEYALLDKYFAAFGDGRVRLVVVRNVAEAAKEVPIRQGDWREVKTYLRNLAYDGGTDLGSWKPAEDCAEYLLFTDGLANFGDSQMGSVLPSMLSGQRLYAITSSVEASHTLLRHATQGRIIDLLQCDTAMAMRLLLEDRTTVRLAPEELAGKGEAILVPIDHFGEMNSTNSRFRLAGWVRAREKMEAETITLWSEHPDGIREASHFTLPLDKSIPLNTDEEAPPEARLWGRYAIMKMEANASRNKAAIARLGQEFGVVSRETSLIVLETAADYARYGIEPPASLKAEVERLRAQDSAVGGSIAYLPMESLEWMWAKKVAWWETDFPEMRAVKEAKAVGRRHSTTSHEDDGAHYFAAPPRGNSGRSSLFGPSEDYPAEESGATPQRYREQTHREVIPGTVSMSSVPRDQAGVISGRPENEVGLNPQSLRRNAAQDRLYARIDPRISTAGNSAGYQSEELTRMQRATAPIPPEMGDNTREVTRIALQSWRSDAPYIDRMDKAKNEDMYAIYLDERPAHSLNSAFFLDMADRFFARQMPELGLRVLSNLSELEIENRQLLRMLAYRLLQAKEPRLALGVFERVSELAPYEPQSLRDLANTHIALGDRTQAAELLYEVARRKWDDRFRDINTIALTELNALLATSGASLDIGPFDSRLLKNLPSDMRVVLAWDTDDTDMDLWITDPDGEKCYYDNRLTTLGGAMSSDCTAGYGPEEFMLRKGKHGKYTVEAHYFGSSKQTISGEVTLFVAIFTDFGMPTQKERVVTMRLKHKEAKIFVGEVLL